jgi:hypothetical protein
MFVPIGQLLRPSWGEGVEEYGATSAASVEYNFVRSSGYVSPAVSIVVVLLIAAVAMAVALRALERKEIH